MGSRIHSWLERARDAAEEGDIPGTRAALKEAFSRAQRDAEVWTVGGSCLLRAGSAVDALGCADRALEWEESHAPAHHLRFEARWALGNPHGALASARKALELAPAEHGWRAQIVEHLLSAGDPSQAWGVASQNPAPEDASEALLVVALRAASGAHEGEVIPLASALLNQSEEHRVSAWEALVEAGEVDAARAMADAAPDPLIREHLRARSALFGADLAALDGHVAALDAGGASLEAALHAGAAAVLRGEWEVAMGALERVLDDRPGHPEALCWQSEALRGLGQWAEAQAAAERACRASQGRHLAGEINQMLARIAERGQESDAVLDGGTIAPLAHALLPLAPDFTIVWEGRVKVVRALLEHGLERMGGNRTSAPTVIPEGGEGAWERFIPGAAPAQRARRIQARLWTQSPERVLQDLERCARAEEGAVAVRTIAGNTALWMGRLDLAAEHFEGARSAHADAFDARVGLAAVALLSGDAEAAASTLVELGRGESQSPAHLLWCAEALRRSGEEANSQLLLTELMQRFGAYPAAWLNRGLITDPGEAIQELERCAPVFLRDALRGAGVQRSAALADSDAGARVLEAGLAMMRGNRVGEVLTWFVSEEGLRISSWRGQRED